MKKVLLVMAIAATLLTGCNMTDSPTCTDNAFTLGVAAPKPPAPKAPAQKAPKQKAPVIKEPKRGTNGVVVVDADTDYNDDDCD